MNPQILIAIIVVLAIVEVLGRAFDYNVFAAVWKRLLGFLCGGSRCVALVVPYKNAR
jgi:hypothetical protein